MLTECLFLASSMLILSGVLVMGIHIVECFMDELGIMPWLCKLFRVDLNTEE